MLRYLLDTNLCIRVLRTRPASLRCRFNREADGYRSLDGIVAPFYKSPLAQTSF